MTIWWCAAKIISPF